MSLDIRMSEEGDAELLAPNLRPIDVQEIYCASNLQPLEALNECFVFCDICNTAVLDGVPIAMYGLTIKPWGAVPWLLGSSTIDTVKVSMAKLSSQTVDSWVMRYGLLRNFVHADNTTSIRWLRDHLLFDISDKLVFLGGEPFRMFERSN